MKQLKLSLTILLMVGVLFPQEAVNLTEELDIAKIKRRAKADAKSDFNTQRKFGWGGSCCIAFGGFVLIYEGLIRGFGLSPSGPAPFEIALIAPFVVAGFFPVNLPQYREKELLSRSSEYHRKVYRAQYSRQIKIQRMKYVLVGGVPTFAIVVYVSLQAFARTSI